MGISYCRLGGRIRITASEKKMKRSEVKLHHQDTEENENLALQKLLLSSLKREDQQIVKSIKILRRSKSPQQHRRSSIWKDVQMIVHNVCLCGIGSRIRCSVLKYKIGFKHCHVVMSENFTRIAL